MRIEPEEIAAIADAVRARVSPDLDQRLQKLSAQVAALSDAVRSAPVTLTDIARELGRHVEWVRTHRWAQPDYGVPDLPGIPKSWFRATWDAWKPQLQQRRDAWERMTPSQQLASLKQIEARKTAAVGRLEVVREGGRGKSA